MKTIIIFFLFIISIQAQEWIKIGDGLYKKSEIIGISYEVQSEGGYITVKYNGNNDVFAIDRKAYEKALKELRKPKKTMQQISIEAKQKTDADLRGDVDLYKEFVKRYIKDWQEYKWFDSTFYNFMEYLEEKYK